MIKIYLRFKLNIIELLIKWYLDLQHCTSTQLTKLENSKYRVLSHLRRIICE